MKLFNRKSMNIEGAKIEQRESDLNMTVSVDTNRISIAKFITRLSHICSFTDIYIKEMPMETVITHIYQNQTIVDNNNY